MDDLAGQAVPEFPGGELPVQEPPVALVGGSAKAICWGHEASQLAMPLTALYVKPVCGAEPAVATSCVLGLSEIVGAADQAATLAGRAAVHAPLDDPPAVASLLDSLREAGAHDQAATLLARDPAAHVAVDPPGFDSFLRKALYAAADQTNPVPG